MLGSVQLLCWGLWHIEVAVQHSTLLDARALAVPQSKRCGVTASVCLYNTHCQRPGLKHTGLCTGSASDLQERVVRPWLAAHCRREAAAALRGIHARLWLLFPGDGGDAQHGAAYVRLLRSLPRGGDKVGDALYFFSEAHLRCL